MSHLYVHAVEHLYNSNDRLNAFYTANMFEAVFKQCAKTFLNYFADTYINKNWMNIIYRINMHIIGSLKFKKE